MVGASERNNNKKSIDKYLRFQIDVDHSAQKKEKSTLKRVPLSHKLHRYHIGLQIFLFYLPRHIDSAMTCYDEVSVEHY